MPQSYTTLDYRTYTRPPENSSDVWRIRFKDEFTSTKPHGYVGYIPRSKLAEAIGNTRHIYNSKNKEEEILRLIRMYDDPITNEPRGQLFIYVPNDKSEPLQTIGVFEIKVN